MKLIHIITSLEKGGAEEMLKRLLRASELGQEKNIKVVSLLGKNKIDDDLCRRGFDTHYLGISGPYSLVVGLAKLFWLCLMFRPKVIQSWLYHADLVAGVVGRLAFVRTIVWNIRCEALTTNRASKATMVVFNLCKFLSYVVPTKIVCVGESAMRTHVQVGFCKKKMTVIGNGYDLEKFGFSEESRAKIRSEWDISSADIVIGCVGRYHIDKGQDILIEAAKILLPLHANVKIALVGRGCSSENVNITNLAIPAELRSRILLLGEKDNIAEILSAFDVYCMPSRTEGFPNSLAEAMLSELPCIATDVGDTSVLAGESVFLVEPNNVTALAEGLTKLLNLSPQELVSLSKNSRQQVVRNFSILSVRDRFNNLYESLAKN